jgi:hypothetical protein
MKILLLALLTLAMPLQAGEEKHPIDRAMDAAMEKDPSTAGMVQAISKANKQWDKEMNALYLDEGKRGRHGLLMSCLRDGATFGRRRTMPRQVHSEFAGAMYHVVAREDRRKAIVKNRLFAKCSRKAAASNRVAGKPKKDRNNVKKPCLTPYPRTAPAPPTQRLPVGLWRNTPHD